MMSTWTGKSPNEEKMPFIFYKPLICVLQVIDLYVTDEWLVAYKAIVSILILTIVSYPNTPVRERL